MYIGDIQEASKKEENTHPQKQQDYDLLSY